MPGVMGTKSGMTGQHPADDQEDGADHGQHDLDKQIYSSMMSVSALMSEGISR